MESDNRRRALLVLFGALLAFAWSCAGADDDNSPAGATGDVGEVIPTELFIYDDASLAAVDTIVTASGLVYIEIEAGDGQLPGHGSLVSVHYTGTLEDGTVFDSSYPRRAPFRFALGLGVVIAGWDEGFALMSTGSRARLIIPPELGYGSRGSGNVIPPDATIIFDVWLTKIE